MIKGNKHRRKIITIVILDVVIIAALVIYFGVIRPRPPINIKGILLNQPIEIADFHFIDNHNQPFTKDTIKGQWTFVFFGFTHCEMICPTTLDLLNRVYALLENDLQNKAFLPKVVFISVDPERDSIDKINQFVNSFNPNFIGARADKRETDLLEKQLHVTVKQFQEKNQPANYIINHSMDIILLNPEAKIHAYFTYPYDAENIAKDYELIIKTFKF